MFFGTRLILKIMKTDGLEFPDKVGGAIVGMIGQNIAATLTFFLIYTAIPVKTTEVVYNSYWIKIMRPIHLATYPYYLNFLETRTQILVQIEDFRRHARHGIVDDLATAQQNHGVAQHRAAITADHAASVLGL